MRKNLLLSAMAAWTALAVISSVRASSLSEGLVGHWPMEKLHGDTLKDVSGNHRDATADDVKSVEGRGGHVLFFDGEKSVAYLPDQPVFEVTGDYGVSLWVRVELGDEHDGPLYAQPGFSISVFRGALRVTFRNSAYPKTGYADLMGPKVNDGEWHHVVFSYARKTGESALYDNGQAAAKKVFAHPPENCAPTTVGFISRFHFKGEMSDLYVYSRTLDIEDVGALHNAKVSP